ncbi:MAG: hypothetical protein MPL62_16920 [Alphaproteobacteria bacterium]|nr:hypothetical protein [Alphaproteobacteria bacterium]
MPASPNPAACLLAASATSPPSAAATPSARRNASRAACGTRTMAPSPTISANAARTGSESGPSRYQ